MAIEYHDFLGLKSSKFDSDFCTASIVNYEQPVSEEWHCHENFHLSAILKGGNLESRRDKDIQVTPGKLMFYHQGEIHRNRFTAFPSKNLNLEIKDAFFKKYDLDAAYWKATDLGDLDRYFYLIKTYNELIINDQYTPDAIHASLRSVFSEERALNAMPDWLPKIQEIVGARWNEFISLEDLASELQVHPVTISKYFRKYYQCTLADYMRKIKVEKALYLLLHTSKKITETALICGFSDHSHMTRLFKFYLGFTPKEIDRF